jgi:hypothetical protein
MPGDSQHTDGECEPQNNHTQSGFGPVLHDQAEQEQAGAQ